MDMLAAGAPVAGQDFQMALPVGVASEQGLQIKTIWAARAISVLFPQISTIYGFRQDPLKWHPNGLAIDVMIPDHDSPPVSSSATRSPGMPWQTPNVGACSM
ncbi:hypothetical protein I546_3966 [Mycobacterium kansasii 732]|nr:hypothetical protein I546_3966 [Mycobacterium kansasii 732]